VIRPGGRREAAADNGGLASALAAGAAFYLLGATALAQPATPAPVEQPDFSTGLWSRSNLLGDAGGVRSGLWNLGITLGLQDFNEVWGNISGSVQRGATYDGLTVMGIGLDTQRAFGWEGGTFNVSALQIRGQNIAVDNLLNLQTPSGILAQPTTRLWEAWFQQSFLDGRFELKLGQLSLDQEFMTSAGSSLFLNTVMGWPMLPSADLYAGGPAYPLSSLGMRLRAQPGGGFTTLLGVSDDNPPGGPFNNDSQLRGSSRWGGNFSLRTGALVIGEVQYALNQPGNGEMVSAGAATGGLPGSYKLGFWYDSGAFPDQRFDNTGGLLADPASSGVPRLLRNNFSLYAVADQMVWRPSEDSPRAVGLFARVMGAPGDRNLISLGVNAGATLKAPVEGRDNDTVGIGFGIARVSSGARAFDSDVAAFSGPASFVRSTETFIEVTYQASIAPWWQFQPDFQYVFNPGGGVANPNDPARRIGAEAILGLRNVITF
jgi:porin